MILSYSPSKQLLLSPTRTFAEAYDKQLRMYSLQDEKEKHLFLVSFSSLVKEITISVDSPELPNGMYVTRVGFIMYLGSPRGGIEDTWHEAQSKVLSNHICTKLSKPI